MRGSRRSPRTGRRDDHRRRFDESISRWLEQTAPARLPDRVLEATFERTRGSRQQVGWRAMREAGRRDPSGPGARRCRRVVLAMAAVAFGLYDDRPARRRPSPSRRSPKPASSAPGTAPATPTAAPEMTVDVPGRTVRLEIVVNDDLASVCSGTPSTMTGTGRSRATTACDPHARLHLRRRQRAAGPERPAPRAAASQPHLLP